MLLRNFQNILNRINFRANKTARLSFIGDSKTIIIHIKSDKFEKPTLSQNMDLKIVKKQKKKKSNKKLQHS